MKKLTEMSKEEFIQLFNDAKPLEFVAQNVFKGNLSFGRLYVGFIGSFAEMAIIDDWFKNDRDSMGYVIEINAIII